MVELLVYILCIVIKGPVKAWNHLAISINIETPSPGYLLHNIIVLLFSPQYILIPTSETNLRE